jgi:16S rRNA C1402 N4-methylase RsmH
MMKLSEILEENAKFDQHVPVLLKEILEVFSIYQDKSTVKYLDGTFGRGGHFQCLKKLLPQMKTVALDQDPDAIAYAREHFSPMVESGELALEHKNFSKFSDLNLGLFDMMLLDLGVSSPQLDESHRGFSFYHNGPLDMRMDGTQQLKASDLINELSEKELNDLFFKLGEVEETLPKMMEALNPGGRLAVISFHSLEDRIVKYAFKDSDLGKQIHKKVIIPTDEECEKNPRARSAKLRVFERS